MLTFDIRIRIFKSMDIKSQIEKMISNGMTQGDLEKRSGVTQATISRIASGRHRRFKKTTVKKINAVYKEFTEKKSSLLLSFCFVMIIIINQTRG